MCKSLEEFEKTRRSLDELAKDGFKGVGEPDENGVYPQMSKGNIIWWYAPSFSVPGKPEYYQIGK